MIFSLAGVFALAMAWLGAFVGDTSSDPPQHHPANRAVPGDVPPELRGYIDQMETPIRVMELPDYVDGELPSRISKSQALEDIEILGYILDNAYSGRYYWQQHGMDFVRAYASLRDYVHAQKNRTISTKAFEKQIVHALHGINDPHSAVIGHKTTEFFTRVRFYFSRLVVEKRGDAYVIVHSLEPRVPVGSVYLDARDRLFPTLSPAGKEHFLVGQMSTQPLRRLRIKLERGEALVSLHPCRIGDIKYDRFDNIIETTKVEGIPIVRSSSFWVEGKIKELEAFSESGKMLQNEPYFVWNLLANDGGITHYPAAFIENFNGMQQDESWEAHLHSTAIAQAYLPKKNGWSSWPAAWLDDATPISEVPEYKRAHVLQVREEKKDLIAHPRRFWTIAKQKPERKVGTFKGMVVVLSNHRNGSAGNNALAMSKSIPKSIIVGENSNMTYTFANTRNFSLKHSRIKLRLPGRLIVHPENSIEQGFLPNYWLDSADPVAEVVRWLREPNRYQFIYRD